jgi:hypothetical protein
MQDIRNTERPEFLGTIMSDKLAFEKRHEIPMQPGESSSSLL